MDERAHGRRAALADGEQALAASRALTNPPLLHRLSINLFGSSSPGTHTPTSSSSPNVFDGHVTSPPSSLGSSRPSLSKPSVEIPRPRSDEESPEVYLQRVVEAVSKADVATVLASRYVLIILAVLVDLSGKLP